MAHLCGGGSCHRHASALLFLLHTMVAHPLPDMQLCRVNTSAAGTCASRPISTGPTHLQRLTDASQAIVVHRRDHLAWKRLACLRMPRGKVLRPQRDRPTCSSEQLFPSCADPNSERCY